jgi:hypothetical protein
MQPLSGLRAQIVSIIGYRRRNESLEHSHEIGMGEHSPTLQCPSLPSIEASTTMNSGHKVPIDEGLVSGSHNLTIGGVSFVEGLHERVPHL